MDNHHNGLNDVKRLGHLVSSKVFIETCSISSESLSFFTGKRAGVVSKWTVGNSGEEGLVAKESTAPMTARAQRAAIRRRSELEPRTSPSKA